MGSWVNGAWVWNFTWRRVLREWELDMLNHMKSILQSFAPSLNSADSWLWLANPEGKYTVQSAYISLQDHGPDLIEDTFKYLWSVPAPSNVLAFSWKVFHDRIQSRVNLSKRHALPPPADVQCPMCLLQEETSMHLLFSCPAAWNIWMACYKWFGFSTVLPNNGKEHFLQHVQPWWAKSQKQGAWAVWLAIIWAIWNSRNNYIFNNVPLNIDKVIDGIQFKSWSWLRGKVKGFNYSIYEWQVQPCIAIASL
ncbi:uncharacterized protein LOC130736644 [Lotus japonicus]|uniref:uncharacterized protein LOC130736644 n=1 Tax=Lotus japonicus TaxID=34305 RepID=UPI0025885ED9|nr:uncharacterized protein LOC130736644 [Lotus japonicus]